MKLGTAGTRLYAVATLAVVVWVAFGLTHPGQVKSVPVNLVSGGLMAVFLAWTSEVVKGQRKG